MGASYGGGLLIGASGDDIDLDLELNIDSLDSEGITSFSPYYDADLDECYWGFEIPYIKVSKIDSEWIKRTQELAGKFKRITGADAHLIGCQDIC